MSGTDKRLDPALQGHRVTRAALALLIALALPAPAAAAETVPVPRLRPVTAASLPLRPPPAADSLCAAVLARAGVVAVPVDAVDDGRCGIAEPMAVSAFGGGDIALTETAVLACPTAETLAAWLDGTVRPAARQILGGDLVGIRVAASYVCRTRNSAPGARLSEHARGRAIDISAFEIAGHGWLDVGAADGSGRRFLRTVRQGACGPFKTVLGPGADAHHADHFHLDTATRRNGSTYCR